ncbi:hypothetical protein VTJ49DRAFT_4631 [Mycothermus thermophilus]|uniref:Fork-head domain-containing protein n=1 Tax=Humicola insolens TaxID=85995 RepID=A0ABR3V4V8_HUMIN
MEPMFGPSPRQVVQHTSPSPGPTGSDQQLPTGMTALRDCDGHGSQEDHHAQSDWIACLGAPASFSGTSSFENYALHSSPSAVSNLAQSGSDPTSPRSWQSSGHLIPTSWETAATADQLSDAFQNLDPQLTGYLSASQQDPNVAAVASFSSDSFTFVSEQGCTPSDDEFQDLRSNTVPFPSGYRPPTASQHAYPLTPESGQPLSPCSTTLSLSMDVGPPGSPGDDLALLGQQQDKQLQQQQQQQSAENGCADKTSPSQAPTSAASETKTEEPYAKLIHRAFMSTPRRAMTLQEIYQWFRENTDKGKDDTKGWQNSIRHNLSMNQAFQKRERPASSSTEGDSNGLGDGKKSTEWYLMDWAIKGVESTTRYRKENQSRRAAAQAAAAGRVVAHPVSQNRVYRSSYTPPHVLGRKNISPIARRTRQGLRSSASGGRGVGGPIHMSQHGGGLLEAYHPFGPHHFTSIPTPEMIGGSYGAGGPMYYPQHHPQQPASMMDMALTADGGVMMDAMVYGIPPSQPPTTAPTTPRGPSSEPPGIQQGGGDIPHRHHQHDHFFYQQPQQEQQQALQSQQPSYPPPQPLTNYPLTTLPATTSMSVPVPVAVAVAPMYEQLAVEVDGLPPWAMSATAAAGLDPMQVMDGLAGMQQMHGGVGGGMQLKMERSCSAGSDGSGYSSSSSSSSSSRGEGIGGGGGGGGDGGVVVVEGVPGVAGSGVGREGDGGEVAGGGQGGGQGQGMGF